MTAESYEDALIRIAHALNKRGWIVEEEAGIGESAIRNLGRNPEHLKECGWNGSEIRCDGEYYSDRANHHILWDEDNITYEKAISELREWVRTHPA